MGPPDLIQHRNRNVIAVSGVKNSGKTTVLSGIIPVLRELGLSVAVIKHDGHDFEPDVPGTDSFKLRQAGAQAVAVFSPRRSMVTIEREGTTLEEMIGQVSDMNLILVEGAKHSPYPKIEIVRAAVSDQSVCEAATLLALATDTDLKIPGVPRVTLDDYQALAGVIAKYYMRHATSAT
ncbi:molybdopterin-guanine dinucleotide biosynthesis protein B [Deltaproteobacteria bacterium Smac51]|nr:molybdopterin-guanine dinucleotide biosynthesis protein B [Deltaproteobacteria bacterium Smac51]